MTNFRRCTGVRNQLQYFIVYLLKASKGERRDAGIIPAPDLIVVVIESTLHKPEC